MRVAMLAALFAPLFAAGQPVRSGSVAYLQSYIETVTALVDRLENANEDSLREYAVQIAGISETASRKFSRMRASDAQSMQVAPVIGNLNGKPNVSFVLLPSQVATPAPVVRNIDDIAGCAQNVRFFGAAFQRSKSRNIAEMREALEVLRWLL